MKYSLKYSVILIKIFLGVFFICPNFSLAQTPASLHCSLDGNIRYRFEKWNNMNARSYGNNPDIGESDDNILLQRVIVGTTIKYNNKITFSAHLQDSRAIGWSLNNAKEPDAFKIHPQNHSEPYYIMNPHEEFFEIYDASITIDSIFKNLSIIAGRQKIAYTDYRIFGPGSWGNTGRWTWDAVRVAVNKEKWSGGIWVGGTKIHDPKKTYMPFTHTEYSGGGMHGNLKVTGFLNADIYLVHKHQGSADYIRDKKISRNWTGFRIYNPESLEWQYEISSTYEWGQESNSAIHAFGHFLKFGYQFNQFAWQPNLTFRYTYASGNNPETGQNELFDPAFGAGDRYYGWMNLVKWSNLDDREFMLELFPMDGMQIELKYNRLIIPQPEGEMINGNLELLPGKQHLGNEIDLYAKYDINNNWQFVSIF